MNKNPKSEFIASIIFSVLFAVFSGSFFALHYYIIGSICLALTALSIYMMYNNYNKYNQFKEEQAKARQKLEDEEKYKQKFADVKTIVKVEKLIPNNIGKKYNSKIKNKTIVVFDIETTGLGENDEIVEIGAVKIKDGKIVEKFSSLVKPSIPISYDATVINGISNEMVKFEPPIEIVINDFFNFTKDCILCGHNAKSFDFKFIKKAGEKYGLVFNNEIIDTLEESRKDKNIAVENHKLETLKQYFNIKTEKNHRAYDDAYATAEILLYLNEIKNEKQETNKKIV